LGERLPGKVICAGRSLQKAEKFAATTNGRVLPMKLDAGLPLQPEQFEEVRLVVMCLDQSEPAIAKLCAELSIHYIDISAQHGILSRIEQYDESARKSGAVLALSVGLAPGMTNLLAKKAASTLDKVDGIDIAIMLGLGEEHGDAAIDWTFDQLQAGFGHGRKFRLGGDLGSRKAYRFDFSDQHVLPRTLGASEARTFLCFDSKLVTAGISLAKRTGLLRALRLPPVRRLAKLALKRIKLGSDRFAIQVEASGTKAGKARTFSYAAEGSNEVEMTAQIASAVSESMYEGVYPGGVFHIEQLFDWEDIIRRAGNEGLEWRSV
jgi:saccharopine dehydrogenase-like NADP-dependent oxidoreductase